MYDMTDHHASSATRRDLLGPVTCATCGCRLQSVGRGDASVWFHFGAIGGRDARGCRVECVELAHDGSGEPAPTSLLA
jgi:hypothetical protein